MIYFLLQIQVPWIIRTIINSVPPRYGTTALILGSVIAFAFSSIYESVQAFPNVYGIGGFDQFDRSDMNLVAAAIGMIIFSIGGSLLAIYATKKYLIEFSLFLTIIIGWVKGVGALTFFRRLFSWYRRKSNGSINFKEVKIYAMKYLLVISIIFITNTVILWSIYNGMIRNDTIVNIISNVVIIQTIGSAIISTVGIIWKLRHISDQGYPIAILSFIIMVFGAEVYSFQSLLLDGFAYLLGNSSFIIGYLSTLVLLYIRTR